MRSYMMMLGYEGGRTKCSPRGEEVKMHLKVETVDHG